MSPVLNRLFVNTIKINHNRIQNLVHGMSNGDRKEELWWRKVRPTQVFSPETDRDAKFQGAFRRAQVTNGDAQWLNGMINQ